MLPGLGCVLNSSHAMPRYYWVTLNKSSYEMELLIIPVLIHFVWGIKWDNAHNHLYTKLQKLKESMAASLWALFTNTKILRTKKTLSMVILKKKKKIGKVLKTYLL